MMIMLKKISEATKRILREKQEVSPDLQKSVQLLQQSIKSQAAVFIVSDFTDFSDDMQKSLAALAKKARVYALNVFDVLEEFPPKAGEYMAENKGERLIFESKSKHFQHPIPF